MLLHNFHTYCKLPLPSAEIILYRKNLLPEPGPGENSFRVRFNLPTLAEKGSAPVKLVRRFCAQWTFQVSFLLFMLFVFLD